MTMTICAVRKRRLSRLPAAAKICVHLVHLVCQVRQVCQVCPGCVPGVCAFVCAWCVCLCVVNHSAILHPFSSVPIQSIMHECHRAGGVTKGTACSNRAGDCCCTGACGGRHTDLCGESESTTPTPPQPPYTHHSSHP